MPCSPAEAFRSHGPRTVPGPRGAAGSQDHARERGSVSRTAAGAVGVRVAARPVSLAGTRLSCGAWGRFIWSSGLNSVTLETHEDLLGLCGQRVRMCLMSVPLWSDVPCGSHVRWSLW